MAAKRSNSTKPSFLDLEKQFVFYASYHNNPINIFIHLAMGLLLTGIYFYEKKSFNSHPTMEEIIS